MTAPRRAGDPDYTDYSRSRDGFSVALPFGLGTVAGKGWLSIVALILVGAFLTLGGFAYITWAGFQAIAADHKAMNSASDRLACVVALNEAERKQFREHPQPLSFCWWLR